MIRILATALLALCLTASGALATTLVELVEHDGIFYKKFTDEPFTGKLDEGEWRGAFKNGKFEGTWVRYHDNGQPLYKDEEREAPRVEYWENGQVGYKGEFKNGKLEGPWVMYWSNGYKWPELSGTYRNGVRVSD